MKKIAKKTYKNGLGFVSLRLFSNLKPKTTTKINNNFFNDFCNFIWTPKKNGQLDNLVVVNTCRDYSFQNIRKYAFDAYGENNDTSGDKEVEDSRSQGAIEKTLELAAIYIKLSHMNEAAAVLEELSQPFRKMQETGECYGLVARYNSQLADIAQYNKQLELATHHSDIAFKCAYVATDSDTLNSIPYGIRQVCNYCYQKDYPPAVDKLLELLKIGNNSDEPYKANHKIMLFLVNVLAMQGKFDAAEICCNEVVALTNDLVTKIVAHNSLAKTFYDQGEVKFAGECIADAITLCKDSKQISLGIKETIEFNSGVLESAGMCPIPG